MPMTPDRADYLGSMRLAALCVVLPALVLLALLFVWAGSALADEDGVRPGDVAAPLGLDPMRDATPPTVVSLPGVFVPAAPPPSGDVELGPVTLPGERRGDTLMAIAIFFAAVLRGAVGLLRSGFLGTVWATAPKWAQWAVLALLTAVLAGCDSFVTGVGWKSALSTALTALFMSFVSQKAQKAESVAKGGAQ